MMSQLSILQASQLTVGPLSGTPGGGGGGDGKQLFNVKAALWLEPSGAATLIETRRRGGGVRPGHDWVERFREDVCFNGCTALEEKIIYSCHVKPE